MANFGSLTAEIDWRVWGKFQRVSRLGFVIAPTSLNGGQPNFAQFLAVSLAGTLCIHFRGLLPQRKFARCKIHFASNSSILIYWQRYCSALEQWASAKLCGVPHRAPPVFGTVAITTGIGPHCSFFFIFLLCYHLWWIKMCMLGSLAKGITTTTASCLLLYT